MPTGSQSSQAGSFGREAAGPNDFVNTDGLLIGDRPVVAKAQIVYRLPWGVMVVRQPAAPDRSRLRATGARERPRLPDCAADQHGTAYRRSASGGHEPDRSARAERVHADSATKIALFLDALNATNSDSYEGVGSVLGTSSAFGVPTRYIPPRRIQLGFKVRW